MAEDEKALSPKIKQQMTDDQNKTEDSVKMAEDEGLSPKIKQQMTDDQNKTEDLQPDFINTLPHELLLKLFSWLKIEDLISVQRVCHRWRYLAHDFSLWKNYTLTLKYMAKEDIKKLNITPAVRNIDGFAANNAMNAIFENIKDLRQLKCEFEPPITSSQVKSLIEIYPKLNSVVLCVSASDVVQSVDMLKRIECLEKICFYSQHPRTEFIMHKGLRIVNPNNQFKKCVCQSNMVKIFETLTDNNNFPALRGLDIMKCDCEKIFEDSVCRNATAEIIQKRSQQLLSLKVNAETSQVLFNSINMCTRLNQLHLSILGKCSPSVTIDKITELKSLYINLCDKDNYLFLRDLNDSFIKGSWLHLELIYLNIHSEAGINILETVIQYAKQVKKLVYYDSNHKTDEWEVKEISSLSKLEALTLICFKTISEKALVNISKCQNLKGILFMVRETTTENICMHIANMMSKLKKLTYCLFRCGSQFRCLTNRESIDKFIVQHESCLNTTN